MKFPRLSHAIALVAAFVATASLRADPIRVACVGDSITAGSGLKSASTEAYPAIVQQVLGPGYEVRNFGVSGATLLKAGNKPYWSESAFKSATDFDPQIVTIKLGTNDSKPVNWSKHSREFETDYNALIDHFAALPAKPKIYLILPVPIFNNKFNINEPNARNIRRDIKQIATARHLEVIDLYRPLTSDSKFFPDGVHPNAEGSKEMGEIVAKAIQTP